MTFTLRELAVLDALRAERDACGPGVPVAEVAHLAATRWPHALVRGLNARGFVIGEQDGLFAMSHTEPDLDGDVERTTDDASSSAAIPTHSPGAVDGPLSGAIRLFDPAPASHYRSEAA